MSDRPIVCEHLQPLVDHLMTSGKKMTFAGQAWSSNCRVWVYFDCTLDVVGIQREFKFAPCVKLHTHRGTHDGSETGFECGEHQDGVMGKYIETIEPRVGNI